MSRRAAALAAILVTLTIGAPSVADADMLADPTPPASADVAATGISEWSLRKLVRDGHLAARYMVAERLRGEPGDRMTTAELRAEIRCTFRTYRIRDEYAIQQLEAGRWLTLTTRRYPSRLLAVIDIEEMVDRIIAQREQGAS